MARSHESGEPLAAAFAARDAPAFLLAAAAALGAGGTRFAEGRGALAAAAESCGRGFGSFALTCLLALQDGERERPPALAHLLAEVGPGVGANANTGARGDAVRAALVLASKGLGGRVVAKVLLAWNVLDEDIVACTATAELSCFACHGALSEEPASGVALLCDFPSLRGAASVAAAKVLEALVDSQQDALVEKLAAALGESAQVAAVMHYQAAGQLRSAARAVEAFGLSVRFPDAEYAWRASAVDSVLKAGKREAAVGLAMDEPRLHSRCVEGLIALDEVELALDLANAWGKPPSQMPDASTLEARHAARAAVYLQLPSVFEIHVVDSEAQLLDMVAGLQRGSSVGIDAEWRPSKDAPPSLLQLAVHDRAYLIDLIALGASNALGDSLQTLLAYKATEKVGFAAGTDLAKIAKAFPALGSCVQHNREVRDLRDMCAPRITRESGVSKKRALDGMSLSALAERFLGRPLDKAMQMSDWGHRPLSPAQTAYAAMDAWVCCELHALLQADSS